MTGAADAARRSPSPAEVARRAARDALMLPFVFLLSSMVGFGSLARDSGLGLEIALVATAGIWGLPGQIAMAEFHAAGAEVAATAMAVSLANARFMPMAVSLMPLLRQGLRRKGWSYGLVQLMSINSWAAAMRVCPELPFGLRRVYFGVFAGLCLAAALIGTGLGYFAAGTLPRPVTLGLIFLNPLYFALLFAGSRGRPVVLALCAGAASGPPIHLLTPDWGVLVTGLLAGTVAFWATRRGPSGPGRGR